MTEVHPEPTIRCCDLWPRGTLTENKLEAYRRLAARGAIRIRRVVRHEATGYTTVDYWSQLPHAWTLPLLGEMAQRLNQGTQTKLEV